MNNLANLLAPVNAMLNGTSFILVLSGWWAIKRGRRSQHRGLMIAAFCTSSMFLAGYLTRMMLTGVHHFVGSPVARTIYLTILFSHMILAIVLVPLVLRTIYLASRSRFSEHRQIARYTFPIWSYVSATGVVVYFLLYHY